jgi:serine palmitoyltransferase
LNFQPAIQRNSKIILLYLSDKEVCYAIQKGILASRSTVFYYNHNDLDHLVELLEAQAAQDKKVFLVDKFSNPVNLF